MPEVPDERVHFESARTVMTVAASEHEMSLRVSEFRRVYEMVRSVPRPSALLQNCGSIAAGISVTSFLSLIPLSASAAVLDPWVRPAYLILGIASGAVAALLFLTDARVARTSRTDCEAIVKEMDGLYRRFFPEESLSNEQAPTANSRRTPSP
jgi:hypothetical protein